MTGDEARVVGADQITGTDSLRPEAQVRNRHGAGLLRIVDEIALGVQRRGVADDLDGILVGTHRAVGAEAVEQSLEGVGMTGVAVGRVPVEIAVRDIVDDADGELIARRVLGEFVVHALDHARREFLR